MPRCSNGHECGLVMFCPACGAIVPYADLARGLASVPGPEGELEETAVLFAGAARFPVAGAFSCELVAEGPGERRAGRLSVKQLTGDAWPDYLRAYRDGLGSWLQNNGFYDAPRKMAVLDLSGPLGVLAAATIRPEDGVAVLGLAAGSGSTPVEQNATYVAVEAAQRRKLPMVVVPRSMLAPLTYYDPQEGLVTGYAALSRPLVRLSSSLGQLQGFLYEGARLGVLPYVLRGVVSASDAVYRSPRDAAKALKATALKDGEEVSSAFLFGAGPRKAAPNFDGAFDEFLSGLKGLIAARRLFVPVEGPTYDLVAVLGSEAGAGLDGVKEGYETIVKRSPDMGVEALASLV